jgi:hypothetical protein
MRRLNPRKRPNYGPTVLSYTTDSRALTLPGVVVHRIRGQVAVLGTTDCQIAMSEVAATKTFPVNLGRSLPGRTSPYPDAPGRWVARYPERQVSGGFLDIPVDTVVGSPRPELLTRRLLNAGNHRRAASGSGELKGQAFLLASDCAYATRFRPANFARYSALSAS